MAQASYSGIVKVGATVINDIMTYDQNFKMLLEETTAFSTATPGTQTFLPTLLDGKIKFSGSWNKTDTGQGTIETNFFARTKTTFSVLPDGVKIYTWSAWIEEYQVKGETKGKVNVDASLQLDGGVTIT